VFASSTSAPRFAVVIVMSLSLLAACGGGSSSGATKTATGGKIDVNAYDTPKFDVGTIKASPGPLTVTLHEKGNEIHTFTVTGHDFNLKVDSSTPTASGTVNLPAGTYTFECTTSGHAAQGMRGKIVVS
jgi:plastocyanin